MKKFSLVVMVFIIGLLSGCSEFEGPPDFREIHWGMSESDVIKIEGNNYTEKALDNGNKTIIYKDIKYKGVTCSLQYAFVDGKCYRGAYLMEGQAGSNIDSAFLDTQ